MIPFNDFGDLVSNDILDMVGEDVTYRDATGEYSIKVVIEKTFLSLESAITRGYLISFSKSSVTPQANGTVISSEGSYRLVSEYRDDLAFNDRWFDTWEARLL